MQGRMKEHPLAQDAIDLLMQSQPVGNLATISPDGFPYITPVHFITMDGKIYIHGLCTGQKLDYLKANPKIGFELYKMNGLIHDTDFPCETNTDYQSVILTGFARIIESEEVKIKVLNEIVKKYTPQHIGKSYPTTMLRSTGIIEITTSTITGKYFN